MIPPQSPAEEVGAYLVEADARVNRLLGIALGEIASGRASCHLTVNENHINSRQVCHGGILFALADAALAYASCSTNRPAVTLVGTISFSRPARLGDVLTATAELQADGRRTCTAAARITDQLGRLIALAQSTGLRFDESVLPLSRVPPR